MEEGSLMHYDPIGSDPEKRPLDLRTWIEIDTKAIDHNLNIIKKLIPESCQIMGIVKSNAYGHGLYDFSSYLVSKGIQWLGVDSVVEAISLVGANINCSILILGYTLPELLPKVHEHDFSITISSMPALRELESNWNFDEPVKIHLKIDTGLHRQGFLPEEIQQVIEEIKRINKNTEKINIEGIYSHLADAKRTNGTVYSKEQLGVFDRVMAEFNEAGYNSLKHMHASPGLVRFGPGNDDMVRVGALLYGILPSDEMTKTYEEKVKLRPILAWKTIITEIKKLPKGSYIGYNRSEQLARDSLVAVCPVGYWHGYPGSLSGKGVVLVQGKPAKILGKVSMDMITIDCTDIYDDIDKAHLGDVVTLMAGDSQSPVSAHAMARLAGISTLELVTCLNSRIKRIYR
jgi:alanine racemase